MSTRVEEVVHYFWYRTLLRIRFLIVKKANQNYIVYLHEIQAFSTLYYNFFFQFKIDQFADYSTLNSSILFYFICRESLLLLFGFNIALFKIEINK